MGFLSTLSHSIAQFRAKQNQTLSPVSDNRGGWWPLIREPFTGAWQRNLEVDQTTASSFYAIFACATLIAGDVSKLRMKLVTKVGNI